jgi:hypothetical protein
MLSLATHVILWLPGILVWPLLFEVIPRYLPKFAYDWTPADQKFWQTNHPGIAPAFVMKDVVEQPRPLAWLLLALIIVFAIGHITAPLRKSALFYTIFVVTFAVRCMGTFSGMQHLHMSPAAWLQMLPWDSASFFKGLFLFWMIQWRIWDHSYLSVHGDNASRSRKPSAIPSGTTEPSLSNPDHSLVTIDEAKTSPVPTSTSTNNDGDKKDASQAPRQIGFRDAMVRLAYYHIIDNNLHMIWLRCFWPFGEGEPYTRYLNNSELLNISLALLMMAWTCVRVRERGVIRENDVEKGIVLGECAVTNAGPVSAIDCVLYKSETLLHT